MGPKTCPLFLIGFLLCSFFLKGDGRIHSLKLENDVRRYFKVSSFGYLTGGNLVVNVNSFSFLHYAKDTVFAFSLVRTMSDSLTPYIEAHDATLSCNSILNPGQIEDGDDLYDMDLVSLAFDLKAEKVMVNCSPKLASIMLKSMDTPDNEIIRRRKREVTGNLTISETNHTSIQDEKSNIPVVNEQESVQVLPGGEVDHKNQANTSNDKPVKLDAQPPLVSKGNKGPDTNVDQSDSEQEAGNIVNKSVVGGAAEEADTNELMKGESQSGGSCQTIRSIPLIKIHSDDPLVPKYAFSFKMVIPDPQLEGLYSLFFHSCSNYEGRVFSFVRTNLSLDIVEQNVDSYLSAGEIPLPELYFLLSVVFMGMGFTWFSLVRSKRTEAYKIHYLMGLLVFVKASALLFHGINYHFISTQGAPTETWAILYYITHLLKGALLFITIVLIGTGWAFVKHVLSEKEKNLFMFVIPLQVLANIAEIITEASEEGSIKHNMWREVFILVDLICCGAILFPVVWSIRHLQEAAHIDGKAAVNLVKLKLFRRFYVIVVCYIYFTRIIVYLLKVSVPFQFEWMDVLIQHAAIGVFFCLTGYHFQPTPQNPYFRVDIEDRDDLEMEEVLFEVTPNGYGEGLTKLKGNRTLSTKSSNVMVDVDVSDREKLLTKRESSYDYD